MLNVGKVLYIVDTISILKFNRRDKNYLSYCIDNKEDGLDYLFSMIDNSRVRIVFELIFLLRMSDEDQTFIQKSLGEIL